MEVLRSEHWGSISYCCGWGRSASRGPNPLLQAKLGGLRMVPVPWLTSSKPAQMSGSPPPHTHSALTSTHTHSKAPSPRTLSWPHNQNKALRWYLLSQEHSPALWIGISGISSPLQYIFLSLSWSLCPPSGPERAPFPCRLSFDTEHGQISKWPQHGNESAIPNTPTALWL